MYPILVSQVLPNISISSRFNLRPLTSLTSFLHINNKKLHWVVAVLLSQTP